MPKREEPKCLQGKSTATQFKPGNREQLKAKDKPRAWSYRQEMRILAAKPIKWDMLTSEDKSQRQAELRRLVMDGCDPKGKKGPKNPSIVRVMVVRMLEKALTRMEPAMLDLIITNTEGRLPQLLLDGDINDLPPEYTPDLASAEQAYRDYVKKR